MQQVTTNGNTSNVGISITAGGLSTNSLTDTALTLGSVLFSGAGGLVSQDNPAFFWDDTNNRLGINTNTPGNSLDVHSAGTNPILALNNTAGNQSAISFLNTAVAKWRIGNAATTNTFDIFNFNLSANAIKINNGDNSVEIPNIIKVQSNGSTFGTNANGSDPVKIQGNNAGKVFNFLNSAGGTADLYVAGTSTSSAFYFSTFSTANALRVENSGAVLVNNPSDDGVNKLQVNGNIRLTGTLTNGTYSYTLPSATGTLALTSNLSAYLPLTGGTLTGALSGTSGTFSGNVISNGAVIGALLGGSIEVYNSANSNYFDLKSTGGNFALRTNVGVGAVNALTVAATGVITISNLAGTGSRAVLADASGNLSAPVSDETVKENVQSLKYGLEAIMQLNPISFEYINEYKNYGEGLQIGNIAQDVAKVIPEAVFTTPLTGLMGINYNQFDGIYIKAIQELNNKINTLLQRIELLENK